MDYASRTKAPKSTEGSLLAHTLHEGLVRINIILNALVLGNLAGGRLGTFFDGLLAYIPSGSTESRHPKGSILEPADKRTREDTNRSLNSSRFQSCRVGTLDGFLVGYALSNEHLVRLIGSLLVGTTTLHQTDGSRHGDSLTSRSSDPTGHRTTDGGFADCLQTLADQSTGEQRANATGDSVTSNGRIGEAIGDGINRVGSELVDGTNGRTVFLRNLSFTLGVVSLIESLFRPIGTTCSIGLTGHKTLRELVGVTQLAGSPHTCVIIDDTQTESADAEDRIAEASNSLIGAVTEDLDTITSDLRIRTTLSITLSFSSRHADTGILSVLQLKLEWGEVEIVLFLFRSRVHPSSSGTHGRETVPVDLGLLFESSLFDLSLLGQRHIRGIKDPRISRGIGCESIVQQFLIPRSHGAPSLHGQGNPIERKTPSR